MWRAWVNMASPSPVAGQRNFISGLAENFPSASPTPKSPVKRAWSIPKIKARRKKRKIQSLTSRRRRSQRIQRRSHRRSV